MLTKKEFVESQDRLIKSSDFDPDCWMFDWVSQAKMRAVNHLYDIHAPPHDPVAIAWHYWIAQRKEFQSNFSDENRDNSDTFWAVSWTMETAGLWLACYYASTPSLPGQTFSLAHGGDKHLFRELAREIELWTSDAIKDLILDTEFQSAIMDDVDEIGLVYRTVRPKFLTEAVFHAAVSN